MEPHLLHDFHVITNELLALSDEAQLDRSCLVLCVICQLSNTHEKKEATTVKRHEPPI